MAKVMAVVGAAGAGKTSLIEGLVGILAQRGYRVGVVKHASHPVEGLGPPGKDTWRAARAGAVAVALAGPGGLAFWRREPAAGVAALLGLVPGADLVLLEGFSGEPGIPKILVCGRGGVPKEVAGPVVAVVGNHSGHAAVPRFGYRQLEELADLVVAEAKAL
ncbi:MAG: molybdopterin-guanine dinucleotide biosynthesis protein B [Firmicutes bacterium]|nr:molybdopterin-guanine dinucleotide biosynthesis protein B [Bacillota bacterium]